MPRKSSSHLLHLVHSATCMLSSIAQQDPVTAAAMFRSLRKAAESIEKNFETAFSSPACAHAAYINRVLTIADISVRLGPVIAEGGYSFVHTATPLAHAGRNVRYAVKRMSCPDAESRHRAQKELHFLQQLPPHPNVVRYFGALLDQNDVFLMFEMVDGGSLPQVLARKPGGVPSGPAEALAIFADAVAAVAHLHAQKSPVAIRDVKLENLLYDRLQRRYKLCDFGSATIVAKRYLTRREILAVEDDIASHCSAMYRAPELVDLYQKHFLCEAVDVWALGCVWHALLYAQLPFDGQSSLPILQGLGRVPDRPVYPPTFVRLLHAMLTVDPAERPNVFTVLEVVKRLQGLEIEPRLKEIGADLRAARALDFGHQSSTERPADEPKSDVPDESINMNMEDGKCSTYAISPAQEAQISSAFTQYNTLKDTQSRQPEPTPSSPPLRVDTAQGSPTAAEERRKPERTLFSLDEPTRIVKPVAVRTKGPIPPPAFVSTEPVPSSSDHSAAKIGAEEDDDWTEFAVATTSGSRPSLVHSIDQTPETMVSNNRTVEAATATGFVGVDQSSTASLEAVPALSCVSSMSRSSAMPRTQASESGVGNVAAADFSDLIDALPDNFGAGKNVARP